jgi:hypothetical protein
MSTPAIKAPTDAALPSARGGLLLALPVLLLLTWSERCGALANA